MRLGGLAASIFKSKVTLVRDDDDGDRVHASKSPAAVTRRDASETGLSTQSQFWAHVYGIEGDRVGKAFMTRDYMERLHAPPSSSLSLPPKAQKPTRRAKKRVGPRVFIGRPLASWKVRAVRDVEPSVDVDVSKGKGRGNRWYVGDAAALYEPYGRMPGPSPTPPSTSSSRCSTPVAEMEDGNWPQPEVGECCEWAPALPPGPSGLAGEDVADEGGSTSLSDQDLARAISAALAALSVDASC